MQPVVPESGLAGTVAPNRLQPLRITVQVREDTTDVRPADRHVNDRIRPVELPREFLGAGCLSDHHRARRSPLIKSRGDLVTTSRELGFVDMAAVGDEVAAVLEYCRQHAAMFVRVVDA